MRLRARPRGRQRRDGAPARPQDHSASANSSTKSLIISRTNSGFRVASIASLPLALIENAAAMLNQRRGTTVRCVSGCSKPSSRGCSRSAPAESKLPTRRKNPQTSASGQSGLSQRPRTARRHQGRLGLPPFPSRPKSSPGPCRLRSRSTVLAGPRQLRSDTRCQSCEVLFLFDRW